MLDVFDAETRRARWMRFVLGALAFGACIAWTCIIGRGIPGSTRLWLLSAVGGTVQYGAFVWASAILRRGSDGRGLLARLPLWGELMAAFATWTVTFLAVASLAKL